MVVVFVLAVDWQPFKIQQRNISLYARKIMESYVFLKNPVFFFFNGYM